ncbi:TIGR02265 family protein [Myxococcus sp. K15C18031901]|uniref:TIGR02265 family protein n=1 Tax=Myxococcus dinghuensis TaxID=2906761 RepID=UPI0020A6E7C4|nr:TIGR02265 family protein [Myxococcus dinghuensis]MCP3101252.1 TIGR02265 family protein [Myxococcus dinghuensis]
MTVIAFRSKEREVVDPVNELERRLGLTADEDRARGMFFLGVLDVVRRESGEQAAARCLAASGERRFVPFFLYPVSSFLKMTFSAAELLAPRLGGFDTAMRIIGAQATHDFLDSVVGRSFLMLAAGDPQRLINNLPSGYRTAVTYGERHVTWTKPQEGLFNMFRDFMPHTYHEGVLLAVLQAVGTRTARVRGRPLSMLDCEYVVSWF